MADSAPTPPTENRYLTLVGTARRVVNRRVDIDDRAEIDKRLHPVLGKARKLRRLKALFNKAIGVKISEAETALERLDAAWHGKERPVLALCRIEIDARGLGQVRVVDDETGRVISERALTSKEREAHFQGSLWDDGKPVIPEMKDQGRPDDALAAADKVLDGDLTASDIHKLVEEADKDPSLGDEEEEETPPPPKEKKTRGKKAAPDPAAAPAPSASAPAAAPPATPTPVPAAAAPGAETGKVAEAPVPAEVAPAAAPVAEEPPPAQQVLEAARRAGEMGIGLVVGELPADVVREAAATWTERGTLKAVAEDRWVYVPRPGDAVSFRVTLADSSELVVPPGAFFAFGSDPGGYTVLGLDGDRVRVRTEGETDEGMVPLADFGEQVRTGKLKFLASKPTPEAPEARAEAGEPAGDPLALARGEELAERVGADAAPEAAPAAPAPAPAPAPALTAPAIPPLAPDLRAETKSEVLDMVRDRGAEGLVLDAAAAAFAERSGTKADKLPAVLTAALPELLRELAAEGAIQAAEPDEGVKEPQGTLFWITGSDKPAYPAKKKKSARGAK